jgi:4-amino-4-deoxychorismate lyase
MKNNITNMMTVTLINGEKENQLSPADRGLCYGDGFFETFYCLEGTLQNWSYHWSRMVRSADILQIALPKESVFLSDFEKLKALQGQTPKACVIKIIVTRGTGGRGYSPANCHATSRIISTSSMPEYQQLRESGMRVSILDSVLTAEGKIAGLKHLNRLGQILAKMELDEKGTNEGVVCNAEGYVREGVSSNLFIVRDKTIITAPLNDCGVAGILRDKVIDSAPTICDAEVVERNFTIPDLLAADDAFFTNSLLGVCPVKSIEDRMYRTSNITQSLMSANLEADAPTETH